jgi:prophage regulatory protein
MKQVCAKVNMHRTSIYRLMREGEFPHPLKRKDGASFWIEKDIDDWIDGMVVERDTKQTEGTGDTQ